MKHFLCLAIVLPAALGAPKQRDASPAVTIASPQATVIGSTTAGVDSFVGIPYAQPPTGSLRLKPPQALNASLGTVYATNATALACSQFDIAIDSSGFPPTLSSLLGELLDTPLFQEIQDFGEDCLTLNVIRPAGATSGLPVLFWIFGGAFTLGSSSQYNGTALVVDSIAQGKPIIFVAVNYRVAGFGFMPGAEILAEGSANAGLLDQRLGLQWVADNIAAFGGDPAKVTIFGESAGSISVLDQMILYDGDNSYNGQPLFRGAIMDSGSILPADVVNCPKGQAVYDTVVASGGCSSATDTLECLRALDYNTFLNAANSAPGGIVSYHEAALAYLPRPDGKVLTASPEVVVAEGKYAKIPFIIGDQEDEGTIFSLFSYNLSTTDELVTYLSYMFQDANTTAMDELTTVYPDDSSAGSPYDSSVLNNWYPQYKRLASILGDLLFILTRRVLLNAASSTVPTWSYLASYDSGTPILGTYHGSDLTPVFSTGTDYPASAIHAYYLSFVYSLDPNNGTTGYLNWPQWAPNSELMGFGADSGSLLVDDFRSDNYDFVSTNLASFRQ